MITLRKLAYEVKRLESGGDPSADSQLSDAYIILMLRQAANKMLQMKPFERMNGSGEDGDRSISEMAIASFEVDVEGEEPNKYIDLPEFYINLPFNKGLHSINAIEDPTMSFIPRRAPTVSRNLPCAELEEDQYSYWTKGLKVFFDESMDLSKVLVDLVVLAPDTIGVDDALPIYPEMQYDLIALCRQMLQNTPPQDKRLDNNADIGIKVPVQ